MVKNYTLADNIVSGTINNINIGSWIFNFQSCHNIQHIVDA